MHKKNPTKPKQRPQLPLLPTPLSHPWWVPLKIYTDPGTYFARVQAATAKVKSSLTCSCSPINANDTTVKSYGKRSRSQGRKSYLKLELKGDLNVIIILSNQTLWMFALVAIAFFISNLLAAKCIDGRVAKVTVHSKSRRYLPGSWRSIVLAAWRWVIVLVIFAAIRN